MEQWEHSKESWTPFLENLLRDLRYPHLTIWMWELDSDWFPIGSHGSFSGETGRIIPGSTLPYPPESQSSGHLSQPGSIQKLSLLFKVCSGGESIGCRFYASLYSCRRPTVPQTRPRMPITRKQAWLPWNSRFDLGQNCKSTWNQEAGWSWGNNSRRSSQAPEHIPCCHDCHPNNLAQVVGYGVRPRPTDPTLAQSLVHSATTRLQNFPISNISLPATPPLSAHSSCLSCWLVRAQWEHRCL